MTENLNIAAALLWEAGRVAFAHAASDPRNILHGMRAQELADDLCALGADLQTVPYPLPVGEEADVGQLLAAAMEQFAQIPQEKRVPALGPVAAQVQALRIELGDYRSDGRCGS